MINIIGYYFLILGVFNGLRKTSIGLRQALKYMK